MAAIRRTIQMAALSGMATLALLALAHRPARAAKLNPECLNTNAALCQQVETCSGGFEPNGTCKYILTTLRYYWRN